MARAFKWSVRLTSDVTKFDGFNEEQIGAGPLFPCSVRKENYQCCVMLSLAWQPPYFSARPLFPTTHSPTVAAVHVFTPEGRARSVSAAVPLRGVAWPIAALLIAAPLIVAPLIVGGILIAELQSGRQQ
jgi:hypothetical protein